MIQTQHPTTQPLPVLVNERLCLDPGSCRCADSFHWCVCVCVAIPLHKRCLCFCVAYFFFFLPHFSWLFASNLTARRSKSFAALDAGMHLQCTWRPQSLSFPFPLASLSVDPLSAGVSFRLQGDFFPLCFKPLVRNCCQEPLRPPEGVALLFSGVSRGAQSEN